MHDLLTRRLNKYAELQSQARTSADVHKVLAAAHEGRVETIFVDQNACLWGIFHPNAAVAEIHEAFETGDDDLLDIAARETYLHGGHVFALPHSEMPDGAWAAAIYRY